MRRLTTMLTALCLACALVLLGCGATSAGTVIFEETVSPNEQYVSSEADVVYYTVRVTQAAPGKATVSTESNSGFFEPTSYEVACDGELSADDVSVEWTTLMGGTEPSEDESPCARATAAWTSARSASSPARSRWLPRRPRARRHSRIRLYSGTPEIKGIWFPESRPFLNVSAVGNFLSANQIPLILGPLP